MKWYSYNISEFENEEYHTYYSLMNNEKKIRVDSLRKVEDKKRTVAGEMLARKAISEWCGINYVDIDFGLTSYGKPYARELNVEFNIAHSGDMVVCAVDDRPIGIDIEKIRRIDLKVCKYICSDKELEYILGIPDDISDTAVISDYNKLIRFFEIWTAKEAYFKKKGTGISDLMKLKNVTEENMKKSIIINKMKDYVMAVCIT